MEENVGGADRIARVVAGATLLGGGLFVATDPKWRAAMLAGSAVAFGTAATAYCPANAALGLDTTHGGA